MLAAPGGQRRQQPREGLAFAGDLPKAPWALAMLSAGAEAGEGRKKGPARGSMAPGCVPARGMGSGTAGLAVSTDLSREKEKHVLAWRETESLRVLRTEPGLEDLAEEDTYWCL